MNKKKIINFALVFIKYFYAILKYYYLKYDNFYIKNFIKSYKNKKIKLEILNVIDFIKRYKL